MVQLCTTAMKYKLRKLDKFALIYQVGKFTVFNSSFVEMVPKQRYRLSAALYFSDVRGYFR